MEVSLPSRAWSLLQSRLVRALIFGLTGVIVQTALFEVVGVILALTSLSTATVLGAEVGLITNFFLNNRFSFGDRPHGVLYERLLKFHLVVSGSIFIQWLSLFAAERITTNILILHAVYAGSIIVGFIWNYTWYRLWVWTHSAG